VQTSGIKVALFVPKKLSQNIVFIGNICQYLKALWYIFCTFYGLCVSGFYILYYMKNSEEMNGGDERRR
jgi:hypothetical protein